MGYILAGLLHGVVFLYVGDSIPPRSLHMCLIDLSILPGTTKYTISEEWHVCPVDLVEGYMCNTEQTLVQHGHPAQS